MVCGNLIGMRSNVENVNVNVNVSDASKASGGTYDGSSRSDSSKIDWIELLHHVMHTSCYVRCPCKGHGVGCLWILRKKPNKGGFKGYKTHRYNCAISNSNSSHTDESNTGGGCGHDSTSGSGT